MGRLSYTNSLCNVTWILHFARGDYGTIDIKLGLHQELIDLHVHSIDSEIQTLLPYSIPLIWHYRKLSIIKSC